ncbi:putative gustatory receptor clone PTE03 [Peromyscus californicus insignis]|uniref:putative gustatory receptor clone PTE03 n=1 Tax=Peromyscus californicus insignis TaxID=564181 RepID=UPI0022A7CC4F|nr:putative gustatory receptor clone PTE03 [Peromyscus californicus insignis]
MELKNQTAVSEFHLLGLTDHHKLLPLIFTIFLSVYLITILGNLLIIMAVSSGSQPHTPMYFFLSVLSINDICYSTVTIPKMLVNIQAQYDSISYIECLSQMCFVSVFGGMENLLLAVMAYDRYVAICKPLQYTVIMNHFSCVLMVLFSLFRSIMDALLHSLMVLRLSFCTEVEIPHFFCELARINKLACSDTFLNNFLIFVAAFVFGGGPVTGIAFSYIYIVSSVWLPGENVAKIKGEPSHAIRSGLMVYAIPPQDQDQKSVSASFKIQIMNMPKFLDCSSLQI